MNLPATETPALDLGRLPDRYRAPTAENCVLTLVLAWSVIGAVITIRGCMGPGCMSGSFGNSEEWHAAYATHQRGIAAYWAGNYPEAVADFTAAIAAVGDNWEYWFDRAQAEFAAGDFGAAIRSCSIVLQAQPHYISNIDRIHSICRLQRSRAREQTGDLPIACGPSSRRWERVRGPGPVGAATRE